MTSSDEHSGRPGVLDRFFEYMADIPEVLFARRSNSTESTLPVANSAGNEGTEVTVTTSERQRSRFGRSNGTTASNANAEVSALAAETILELEAQLAEARNQQPDLSQYSEADLAVLASEAATNILRVARTEAAATGAATQKLVESTEVETERLLEEAKQKAEETLRVATEVSQEKRESAEVASQALRAEAAAFIAESRQLADDEVAQLRADADAYAAQVRADVDAHAAKTHETALAEASALVSAATAEAEKLIADALERREGLFVDLETQRQLVLSTLEDSAAIQSAFVEGYGRLRKVLDESVAHLIEPVERARRQISSLDRELAHRDED